MFNANAALRIDRDGLDFTKGWEACYLYVYDDKAKRVKGKIPEWKGEAVKGTLTIGYGHTNAAKHPLKIKQGLRITEKQACEILDVDLDQVEDDIRRSVKVPLTQSQYNALCSLGHNIGPLKKAATLLARLNRGDYDGARAAFDLYVRSGGEVMKGLQNRRDAEQRLWDRRSPVARLIPDDDADADHPAEVDMPKPAKTMASSVEGNAQATGGVISVAKAAQEAHTSTLDASAALDKVIDAKSKAEALGVDVAPMTMWDVVGPYVTNLAGNPMFWVALGLAGLFIWGWLRRRRRLHEEMI